MSELSPLGKAKDMEPALRFWRPRQRRGLYRGEEERRKERAFSFRGSEGYGARTEILEAPAKAAPLLGRGGAAERASFPL